MLFGSAGSQLAIYGSDIDVLVYVPDPEVKFRDLYLSVHKMFLNEDWVEYAEKITSIVPILKIKDAETGLNADICFNRDDSYKGVIYSLSLQVIFPELRPLYFILKVFLKERSNLDLTRLGGVCSFMLLNMITFYLQSHYKRKICQYHC